MLVLWLGRQTSFSLFEGQVSDIRIVFKELIFHILLLKFLISNLILLFLRNLIQIFLFFCNFLKYTLLFWIQTLYQLDIFILGLSTKRIVHFFISNTLFYLFFV